MTLGRKKPDAGSFQLIGHGSKYQETDRAVLLWTFVKKWLGTDAGRWREPQAREWKQLGISDFSKEHPGRVP